MRCDGDHFYSDTKGHTLHYYVWLPDKTPTACVVIVHGIAEHAGRYAHVAESLTTLGYAVYAMDLYGHGKSSGTPAYIEEFSQFSEGLQQFITTVKQWQPNLPVFLLGHSMGGLVVCHFLLQYQSQVSGAILSGPALTIPKLIPNWLVTVGRKIAACCPTLRIRKLAGNLISRDPEVVQAYRADPLVHHSKITTGLGNQIFIAMEQVRAKTHTIGLPLLILNGSADKIVSPDDGALLYDTVASQDKTRKVYDGLYHEILNEPEQDQVLADIGSWLAPRVISRC